MNKGKWRFTLSNRPNLWKSNWRNLFQKPSILRIRDRYWYQSINETWWNLKLRWKTQTKTRVFSLKETFWSKRLLTPRYWMNFIWFNELTFIDAVWTKVKILKCKKFNLNWTVRYSCVRDVWKSIDLKAFSFIKLWNSLLLKTWRRGRKLEQ